MTTLGEILRWFIYTVTGVYHRIAVRLLRRDELLVKSEARFRSLLEAAPDAMVIVDWHGHIQIINAEAERLFGYKREEVLGQHVTSLIPERFRTKHHENHKQYIAAAVARPMGTGLELFALRKDGRE